MLQQVVDTASGGSTKSLDGYKWTIRLLGCSNVAKKAESSPNNGRYTIMAKAFFNGERLESGKVPGAKSFSFSSCAAEWSTIPQPSEWHLLPRFIQVCLVGSDFTGASTLLGSAWIDWQKSLLLQPLGTADSAHASLLNSTNVVHAPSRAVVGSLQFSLACEPSLPLALRDQLWKQCSRHNTYQHEVLQTFKDYTTNWWSDYVQVQPLHRHMHVSLYAVNEVGAEEPVTNWVRPLTSVHIPTPQHALRFVSLLEEPVSDTVGTQSESMWKSTASVLAALKATSTEQALTLGNLLIGFGFKAFLFLGRDTCQNQTTGVLTLDPVEGSVWLWDPKKGRRYESPTLRTRFYSIDCVFNNVEFLANLQPSNVVSDLNFDFTDHRLWKPLKRAAIAACRQAGIYTQYLKRTLTVVKSLLPPADYQLDDFIQLQSKLEAQVADLLIQHRSNSGIPNTKLDPRLSHLLTTIALDLETAHIYSSQVRATGPVFLEQADLISHALHGYLPPRHSFVAHRVSCRNTLNPGKIFAHILNQLPSQKRRGATQGDTLGDLVLCRAEKVRFGLRVQVFRHAEGLFSTWAVLAVSYKNS